MKRSRAPDGVRLIAVGDVHGHLNYLDDLLAALVRTPAPAAKNLRDRFVFLGDYIDRGPDSAGVIDRLIELREAEAGSADGAVFLRGNHEEMMLRFLKDGDMRLGGAWIANGGDETLRSYGVTPPADALDTADFNRSRRDLDAALPPAHLHFLETLSLIHRDGDFIFVHAGLRPDVAVADQDAKDMMWIRDTFLDSQYDFGGLVVHGHSPTPDPELHPNRICVDTGAGKGGYLTAGLFWGTEKAFLHAGPRAPY
ncbi:metallophosphoesterase family protein [Pacificispira sp.]|uniref:metallophosphoesterase family protein n=1 Tax=Pacificispira sp. TaxID=2888761 RepID=UPI003BAB02A4